MADLNERPPNWILRKKEFPFNPFVPNESFLYPLKTSQYLTVFLRVEKGIIGNEWVKVDKPLIATKIYKLLTCNVSI